MSLAVRKTRHETCRNGLSRESTSFRRSVEGGILFELCRFLYTGDIGVKIPNTHNFVIELLVVADSIRLDQLYVYCLAKLRCSDLKTFFALETAYSYDFVCDPKNRARLLSVLREGFLANYNQISSHTQFTSIPRSTLTELIGDSPQRLPSFIVCRWNFYLDKTLDSIAHIKSLLEFGIGIQKSDFVCSLIEVKSGSVLAQGPEHVLPSKGVEIVLDIPTDVVLTWEISGLFKGRQIGLFNSLFLLRQTHADGIYEVQLQDGSANPPTAHLSGSSNYVVFNVNVGGRLTSIAIGDNKLISTIHQFRTFDMRLVHEGRTEGDTRVTLIDMYTLLS
jgi:hypothetical protein